MVRLPDSLVTSISRRTFIPGRNPAGAVAASTGRIASNTRLGSWADFAWTIRPTCVTRERNRSPGSASTVNSAGRSSRMRAASTSSTSASTRSVETSATWRILAIIQTDSPISQR